MSQVDKDFQHLSSSTALDDEQRIKVLSPSMLVFKRFIRNMLAIVGVVCIGAMFLFSFLGGWLMPYGESQVFTEDISMSKDFAGVTQNTEFRFTEKEGMTLSSTARAQFLLALNNGMDTFTVQDKDYSLTEIGDDFYLISEMEKAATAAGTAKNPIITYEEGYSESASFEEAFKEAIANNVTEFEADGAFYTMAKDGKFYSAFVSEEVALGGLEVFDFADANIKETFEFYYQAELALNQGDQTAFSVNGADYSIDLEEDVSRIYKVTDGNKTVYAEISKWIVQPLFPDVFLTLEFKDEMRKTIITGNASFIRTDENGQTEYTVQRDNLRWLVKTQTVSKVVNSYESPSLKHWLGTDGDGMDILTRLMYGGRISLMIGFIVIIIETILGVILGGISGYFGKRIDNLIMRIVDIFYCIPSLPIIIIFGAMMDATRVDPQTRMIYLMLILGFLGWPYVARMVRGQILSLREQEFMVAAEASGISVYRKIFKHLVPNVIPQLIVLATMGLGDIILTESVLSFLGLGVKFPFASWGNIINAVTNAYVMTNFWFVWIPAGFCILITVLGFNFIGDGLRDAFDPKSRR